MSDEDPFDFFLNWLDPDRDQAEKKYGDIRRRLIAMLELRGCTPAEDLASEAIYRFVRRLPAIAQATAEAIPYLYTVAHNLYLDTLDEQFFPLPDDASELPQHNTATDEEKEQFHQCLDRCVDELEGGTRKVVLAYYRWDKGAKIRFRKRLARVLGISRNALGIKIFNIRATLQACIESCMNLPSGRK